MLERVPEELVQRLLFTSSAFASRETGGGLRTPTAAP